MPSQSLSTELVPQSTSDVVAIEKLNKVDLSELWREALDYLDENFAFFLTAVLNMGHPQWNSAIPTAGIMISRDGNEEPKFVFNPNFAAMLSPEELAFIMSHETLHMVMRHHKILTLLQKRGYHERLLNFAADCIVNDFLVNSGFEMGRLRTSGLLFGEDVVGYDCSKSTVRQVYHDLPQELQEAAQHGQEAAEAAARMAGEMAGEIAEFLKESGNSGSSATGDHEWIYDPEGQPQLEKTVEKSVPQELQEKYEKEEGTKKSVSLGPGSEAGALKRFTETRGVSLNWAKLLREVNPDTFKVGKKGELPSWHVPRRKVAALGEIFPDLGQLPSKRKADHKGEIPAIAMYMDGSGSCSDWIDRFVTLARSVPSDQFHLFAFSFSTYVQPMDLRDKDIQLATGGTAFSPIEQSIRQDIMPQLKNKYPKAVVILSDGEGHFEGIRPEEKVAQNWLWLIKGNYSYRNRPGKDVAIEEFMQGMEAVGVK